MDYDIDENCLVFVKTDKISHHNIDGNWLVLFIFFENLRNFEIKILKKLVCI
jgi:hypothetical protein